MVSVSIETLQFAVLQSSLANQISLSRVQENHFEGLALIKVFPARLKGISGKGVAKTLPNGFLEVG